MIGERVLGACIESSVAKSRPVLSSLRRWLLLRVVGVVVVWRRVLGVGADLQYAPNWDGGGSGQDGDGIVVEEQQRVGLGGGMGA